jgi:hypothetical protein
MEFPNWTRRGAEYHQKVSSGAGASTSQRARSLGNESATATGGASSLGWFRPGSGEIHHHPGPAGTVPNQLFLDGNLERAKGFEPSTPTLARLEPLLIGSPPNRGLRP